MTEATTIAAIATPHGVGGISVIRVSGDRAFSVCDRIFRNPKGKKLSDAASHTIVYGHIMEQNKTIDEVLVSVMRAPHTFTGENTVEISCHGGIKVTNAVLSAILANGASLAAPGEFTKRAFLNGRMDLSQAEAVIDVIQSESSLALETATHQLEGNISREINQHRDRLLELCAQIDVIIDYPDEEIDELGEQELKSALSEESAALSALLSSAENGTLIRDGINTVILGRPNVGKSSLFNALANADRAIVTEIAGTTRDVIEERIVLGGVVLNLFDTAGIHDTENPVESIGIEKAEEYGKKADLILFLFDARAGLTDEDQKILKSLSDKKVILLANKSDLTTEFSVKNALPISAKYVKGLDSLAKKTEELFRFGEIAADNSVVITNLRHKQALSAAVEHLNAAKNAVGKVPVDLITIDLTNAVSALGEITGQSVSEEIVNKIFSRFCLGK